MPAILPLSDGCVSEMASSDGVHTRTSSTTGPRTSSTTGSRTSSRTGSTAASQQRLACSPLFGFISLTLVLLACSVSTTFYLISTAQQRQTSTGHIPSTATLDPYWLNVPVPSASNQTTAAANTIALSARRPLAVMMSGGGHRATMTSVGLGRALFNAGVWDQATHVGSVSGGSWFMSQLVHGGKLHDQMRDPSIPVEDIVSEWGDVFARAIHQGIRDGSIDVSMGLYNTTSPSQCSRDSDECGEVVRLTSAFIEAYMYARGAHAMHTYTCAHAHAMCIHMLMCPPSPPCRSLMEYPVANWEAYVDAFLAPYVSAYRISDSTMNEGLKSVSYVVTAGLPIDAWVGGANGGRTQAGLSVEMQQHNESVDLHQEGWPLPIAHVDPAAGASFSGWYLSPDVVRVSLGLRGSSHPPVELKFEDPGITSISAASSAAFGMVASPTYLKQAILWVMRKLNLPVATEAELTASLNVQFQPGGKIETCTPQQLDELAIPFRTSPYGAGGEAPDTYRLVDGAFVENNGVALTVSRMQQDCLSGEVDCGGAKLLTIISTDHSPAVALAKNTGGTGGAHIPHSLGVLFSNFNDPSVGGTVPAWRQSPPTMFEEDFPTVHEWLTYEPIENSTFWAGELTTKRNPYYGVAAGWKIRALLLRPNLDMGTTADGSLGGGTQVFYGGTLAKQYIRNQYAPRAARQAAAVEPVVRAFISGSTESPSTWANLGANTSLLDGARASHRHDDPQPEVEDVFLYQGEFARYVATGISIIIIYLCLSLVGSFILSCVAGHGPFDRSKPIPVLSGLLADGADSLLGSDGLNALANRIGLTLVNRDLYEYDRVAEVRCSGASAVRMPRFLAKQGFRGRSEDPFARKTDAEAEAVARQHAVQQKELQRHAVILAYGDEKERPAALLAMHQSLEEEKRRKDAAKKIEGAYHARCSEQHRAAFRRRAQLYRVPKWLRTAFLCVHHGKQMFSSKVVATLIVLSSLCNALSLSLYGGAYLGPPVLMGRGWTYTRHRIEPFISSLEAHIAQWLRPIVEDGRSGGALRFGTFLQTALAGGAYSFHITLMSMGNVRGARWHFSLVSCIYTGLSLLEYVVLLSTCPSDSADETLCARDAYNIAPGSSELLGPGGGGGVRGRILVPFRWFAAAANVVIFVKYCHQLSLRLRRHTNSRWVRWEAVAKIVERRMRWFARAFAGISPEEIRSAPFPILLAVCTLTNLAASLAFCYVLVAANDILEDVKQSIIANLDSIHSKALKSEALVDSIFALSRDECAVDADAEAAAVDKEEEENDEAPPFPPVPAVTG